jgi:prepilin-type N-terminal cleavage/methylation domain-containing protein/prepilin-type processing-associated H-X9-DG protein
MRKLPDGTVDGFTLVELLVVIVIIATLAALSFVGLTRMRASGDTAVSASSLRQLQLANVSYAADHNGRYASYSTEDEAAGTLVRWYKCPSFIAYLTGDTTQLAANPTSTEVSVPPALLDPTTVRAKKRMWDKIEGNFGMNHEWMTTQPKDANGIKDKYTTTSGVKNPGRTFVFVTATDGAAKYGGRLTWDAANAVEGKTTDGKMAFRHANKATVVFYDGSVGFVTRGDIKRYDGIGGKNNVFWNGTL